MTEIIPGDTTHQGTSNLDFEDDERKSPVAQIETDGGPRNARVEVGPGFYTAPMPGERVHVVEYEDALYAIGGTNVDALESLSPDGGDRGVFCVDETGRITALLRMKKDGSFLLQMDQTALQAKIEIALDGTITLENMVGKVEISPTGTVDINNGNLTVLP